MSTVILPSMETLVEPWLAAAVVGVLMVIYFVRNSGPKKFLPQTEFTSLPLIRKEVLSHDTVRFTFGLPKNYVLGLPTGQHLSLKFTNAEGKAVQRSYTPVSDRDTVGEVSLVIKVYHPSPPKFPNGGQMSQYLDSLKIGDTILANGPKGHVEYLGKGRFTTKPLGKPLEKRYASQIAMMAGGTGITPMLQIIHAIFKNNESTKIKLLYANQTEDDILVRQELEELSKKHPDQFSLWYTVDRAVAKDWKYDTGFISTKMVRDHCLFESRETQFFMCGPPPMIKYACIPALTELGYNDKEWVIF